MIVGFCLALLLMIASGIAYAVIAGFIDLPFLKQKINQPTIESVENSDGTLAITVVNPNEFGTVYYTLDGTSPTEKSTLYAGKLNLTESAQIRATAIRSDRNPSAEYTEFFNVSKSTFKPITLLTQPSSSYTYTGAVLLNDGLKGDNVNYKSGRWIGFQNKDLVAVIDLEKLTEISKVSVQNCIVTGDYILDARNLLVEVSDDGVNYRFLAGLETDPYMKTKHWEDVLKHTVIFPKVMARYVKVTVGTFKKFPKWHGAPDGQAFIFVDEIVVD